MAFGTVVTPWGGWSFPMLAFLVLVLMIAGFGFFFYPFLFPAE